MNFNEIYEKFMNEEYLTKEEREFLFSNTEEIHPCCENGEDELPFEL